MPKLGLERSDKRIKVKFLSENYNISENSNQAISLAEGEYIALLDHDDEISFDALYEVVKLLQKHPDADLIYSDEDKIDMDGKRSSFFFKPDWSPDLLLSQNYISHLGVYRKSIVDRINGFRIGYEGSQDYDLVLRFTEHTNKIYHIPRILYHWRIIAGSLAASPHAKQHVYTVAKRALLDAMHRRKISIMNVDDTKHPGCYRIRHNLLNNKKVSIIIPTKDNLDLLKNCINSILEKTIYNNYELLIIDNQSKNVDTLNYLNSIKSDIIRVIPFKKSFNFSEINNFAVGQVDGDYLLFLNDDTEIISESWIISMLEYCQKERVGAVGAKLLYKDKKIQHAGIVFLSKKLIGHSHKHILNQYPGYFGRPHVVQNISAVTGACLMIKKKHFDEVEGFDEKNLAISYNDVDLCLKLQEKNYLNIYTPFAKLYHWESASRGHQVNYKMKIELDYIKEKWGDLLRNDPYYNPNLSDIEENFTLKL